MFTFYIILGHLINNAVLLKIEFDARSCHDRKRRIKSLIKKMAKSSRKQRKIYD